VGLFSERRGLKPVRKVMQVDSIDAPLRNRLWNALTLFYWNGMRPDGFYVRGSSRIMVQKLWQDFFKRSLDETNNYLWSITYEVIRTYYFKSEWYQVYDFLEFMANNYHDEVANREFMDYCNSILESELSVYRFVGGRITQITSEQEISEIEEALTTPLDAVRIHLKSALDLLSDRQAPDYRNSIKESISAVEAICKKITEDSKATLGQCLKKVEDTIGLHPALKSSFSSLYGYTSSAEGIRHALMDAPSLDFDDAKFMLVSCSAFVNYLTSKASKAGIEI